MKVNSSGREYFIDTFAEISILSRRNSCKAKCVNKITPTEACTPTSGSHKWKKRHNQKAQKHRTTNTANQCNSCGANPLSCGDGKPIDVARAANGTPIYIYRIIKQRFSLKNVSFYHHFYEADTDHNILGLDFIQKHVNIIDFENQELVFKNGERLKFEPVESQFEICSIKLNRTPELVDDQLTSSDTEPDQESESESVQRTDETASKTSETNRERMVTNLEYHKILDQYPRISNPDAWKDAPKHNTKHYIATNGPPCRAKPRRLNAEKLKAAKAIFDDLIEKGICERADPRKSRYSSPLVLVKKPNGELRPCGDYTNLNEQTVKDSYPMPHIHDCNLQIHGCEWYSKIDCEKAYNQIPINPDDIEKTAVTTPFGLFVWKRMSFGLATASQTFQRFIDEVLEGIDGVFPYQDDILLYTKTLEEHIELLHKVLKRLSEYGIIINPDKCVIAVNEVNMLSYHISKNGIRPSAEKREVINSMIKPQTEAELHTYVGLVNYYNRFIPSCSLLLAPLYKLFTQKKSCKKPTKWTPEADRAFSLTKKAMNDVCLTHPDAAKPISVMIDASNYGIGGVVQQLEENEKWRPVQYFGRKLSKTEQRYSTFGRELLAAFASLKKFKHHLEGRDFTLFTDHKALVSAVKKHSESKLDREKRQLEFIRTLTKDVQHIPGKSNQVADALSRAVNSITFPEEVDLYEIYKAQREETNDFKSDEEMARRTLSLPNGKIIVWYETSLGFDRLYIPESKRTEVFNKHHELGHKGVKATKRYMSSKYFWKGMAKDIEVMVKDCVRCLEAKSSRSVQSELQQFSTETCRFHTIHTDIVTMSDESYGFKHCLSVIDRTTRFPMVIPLKDMTAKEVALQLYINWVAMFGTPKNIVTDQGKQFESELFHEMCNLIRSKRCRTTAYHPQSNSMVERFHRTLKETLMAACEEGEWFIKLPAILLLLRNTHKEDLGASSNQLVFGRNMALPGEINDRGLEPGDLPEGFHDKLTEILEKVNQPKPPKVHNLKEGYVPKELATATHVLIKRGQFTKQGRPWSEPCEVIKRDNKTITVKRPNGKTEKVSIDRTKAAPLSYQPPDLTVQKAKKKATKKKAVKQPEATATETSSEPIQTVQTEPKKRGRPKKNASTASGNPSANQKSKQTKKTSETQGVNSNRTSGRVLRSSANKVAEDRQRK